MRHAESGMGTFDVDGVARVVQCAINQDGPVIAGVISGDDGIEATVGLSLAKWWDSCAHHLDGLWDYVVPAKRLDNHSAKLLIFAEMAADMIGVPLFMGGPASPSTEGKLRSYGKRMMPGGAFFIYSGSDSRLPSKRRREASMQALSEFLRGGEAKRA